MKAIIKTVELDFASFDFYENLVVAHLEPEVVFRKPEIRRVSIMCREFFGSNEFVYISDRKNHYNVDPMIYVDASKVETLRGIAVVCHESICLKMAYFEKEFARTPFEVFDELDEAMEWSEEILKK